MKKYLTEEQLCEELQVSRCFIYLRRKKGLPFYRFGKCYRYVLDEVVSWLIEN